MANVNIKFNGKDYLLSCDDGQEECPQDRDADLLVPALQGAVPRRLQRTSGRRRGQLGEYIPERIPRRPRPHLVSLQSDPAGVHLYVRVIGTVGCF